MTATLDQAVATANAVAEALVAALPGPALMAQAHVGGAVPAALADRGLQVAYAGPRSAELGLVLLDRDEVLLAAGGGGRPDDVLRPALEHAAAVVGGGLLGEAVSGAPLLGDPDAVVFDLVGEAGVAGWFAVVLHGAPAPARPVDVTSRLGRISGVEMTLTVEIGRAQIAVRDLLDAQPGTVIELDRSVGAQADVLLNGRLIAHGEIVVLDRRFAVRVTEMVDAADET